jgi:hypothetical protein
MTHPRPLKAREKSTPSQERPPNRRASLANPCETPESIPRRGYVHINALAFNTLLSSQKTDAHQYGTLIPLRGNSPTLLRSTARVKLVSRNFSGTLPAQTSSGRQQLPTASPALDARPPSGGLLGGSLGSPSRLPALRPPQGKMNFTTVANLRQIRDSRRWQTGRYLPITFLPAAEPWSRAPANRLNFLDEAIPAARGQVTTVQQLAAAPGPRAVWRHGRLAG